MKPAETAARIAQATSIRPALAIVLGSGFGALHQAIKSEKEISYEELPGFTPSRVDGHAGRLMIGSFDNFPVVLLCGRSHYYEGFSLAEVTFPIRVLAAFGVRAVVLTNAAGAINPKLRPGDFMALSDHINFMGANPLRGEPVNGPAPFVDLSTTYDPFLNKLLAKAARHARVRLHSGVYLAVSGPCYETPAEIRAFARLGADAIGMSTVPEAIVARHCGMLVAAISCITNAAAGLSSRSICHTEVLETGERVKAQATALLTGFTRIFAQNDLNRALGVASSQGADARV
jgi:purine-nucleoside phosphorylase